MERNVRLVTRDDYPFSDLLCVKRDPSNAFPEKRDIVITPDIISNIKRLKKDQEEAIWLVSEMNITTESMKDVLSDPDYEMNNTMFYILLMIYFTDALIQDNLNITSFDVPALRSNIATIQYIESVHDEAYRLIVEESFKGYKGFDLLPLLRETECAIIDGMKGGKIIDFKNSYFKLFEVTNTRDIGGYFDLIQTMNHLDAPLRFAAFSLIESLLISIFYLIKSMNFIEDNRYKYIIDVNKFVQTDETIHIENAIYIVLQLHLLQDSTCMDDRIQFCKDICTITKILKDITKKTIIGSLPPICSNFMREEYSSLFDYLLQKTTNHYLSPFKLERPLPKIRDEFASWTILPEHVNFFERKDTYLFMTKEDINSFIIKNENKID